MAHSSLSSDLRLNRHCAYCLIPISGEEVKLCGKCGRRAYCSKECQSKDWRNPSESEGQRGQGHKNWCGLLCGEEDIDWKVAPVEGKGLGLIALKPLPARARILVEGCQISPEGHPAIKYLMPGGEEDNLQDKWDLNSLGCDGQEAPILCLRIARVNHACADNAAHIYCPTFKVKILFAERSIEAGEEISINYQPFTTPSSTSLSSYLVGCGAQLQANWGVSCPQNCICKDAEILEDISKSLEIAKTISQLGEEGDVLGALSQVETLITLQKGSGMPYSVFERSRSTLWNGFQFGIMTKASLDQGREYLDTFVGIMGDILHPKSEAMVKYMGFQKDPGSHPNYLKWEESEGLEKKD